MKQKIPIAPDVAALIGDFAEGVENRSLLFDKFVFHKNWPEKKKIDNAARWSIMRISKNAGTLLNQEAADTRRRANGRNVSPGNREKMISDADTAQKLANVKWEGDAFIRDTAKNKAADFISIFAKSFPERCLTVVGKLEGRLALNLSDGLLENAGASLDRLLGLPYIPGSAFKGVARHVALEELKANPSRELLDDFISVFGVSENDFINGDLKSFREILPPRDLKGLVSFLPAYPLSEADMVVDLTNVHYPNYYGKHGVTSDLAKEKPRPNPFPAVETGAEFAFCAVVSVNVPKQKADRLLSKLKVWIETALTEWGLGAKTSAGHGWFSIQNDALERLENGIRKKAEEERKARETAEIEAKRREEERARLEAMSPVERRAEEMAVSLTPETFKGKIREIASLEELDKRALMALCRGRFQDTWLAERKEYLKLKDNPKKAAKNKAFKRVEALLAEADNLGEELP